MLQLEEAPTTMHRDFTAEERLDDLLCRWHQWAQNQRPRLGFGSRSAFAGQYRTSRQYDDENGALDEDIEHSVMSVVDFNIGEMEDPYRSAIYALARSLVYGVAVVWSVRLDQQIERAQQKPANAEQRAFLMRVAKSRLQERLISAGVL